jgi:hypothetical protein
MHGTKLPILQTRPPTLLYMAATPSTVKYYFERWVRRSNVTPSAEIAQEKIDDARYVQRNAAIETVDKVEQILALGPS